ncbi:MAG: hypothetical protein IH946_08350 [Bacteroidetes bacterium]|nr:hypothetical protein [Bacteroidota bacterium]
MELTDEIKIQISSEWKQVVEKIRLQFNKDRKPDLNAVLLLIGINELGFPRSSFSKEEKQDLMHIAICRLLSQEGYYSFTGKDEDGWPHYEAIKSIEQTDRKEQEFLLKMNIIKYFHDL